MGWRITGVVLIGLACLEPGCIATSDWAFSPGGAVLGLASEHLRVREAKLAKHQGTLPTTGACADGEMGDGLALRLAEASLLVMQARFPEARQAEELLLARLAACEVSGPGMVLVLLTLAELARIQDRHQDALGFLRRGLLELGPETSATGRGFRVQLHMSMAASMMARGQLREALEEADSALELVESYHDDGSSRFDECSRYLGAIQLHAVMADLLRRLGRSAEARHHESTLEELLGARSRGATCSSGRDSTPVELASRLLSEDGPPDCDPARAYLEAHGQGFFEEPESVLDALQAVLKCAERHERHVDAMLWGGRWMAIAAALFGPDSLEGARAELDYAVVEFRLDRPAQAITRLESLRQRMQARMGGEHSLLAAILDWQSYLSWQEGRIEEAVALGRAAWGMYRRVLGDIHEKTTETLGRLVNLASQSKRSPEAAYFLREQRRVWLADVTKTKAELAAQADLLAAWECQAGNCAGCEAALHDAFSAGDEAGQIDARTRAEGWYRLVSCQMRNAPFPDPVPAAQRCLEAGGDGALETWQALDCLYTIVNARLGTRDGQAALDLLDTWAPKVIEKMSPAQLKRWHQTRAFTLRALTRFNEAAQEDELAGRLPESDGAPPPTPAPADAPGLSGPPPR
ncbi:MAG TPA: tetratricopeptide repeat protein [Myxococcota bacterium]|nr:tetratricopeptide repeat protein [Myxococcota bacterium]HRY95064.1 tetratricopeptide repeat protein [Myxococcota bacterium]